MVTLALILSDQVGTVQKPGFKCDPLAPWGFSSEALLSSFNLDRHLQSLLRMNRILILLTIFSISAFEPKSYAANFWEEVSKSCAFLLSAHPAEGVARSANSYNEIHPTVRNWIELNQMQLISEMPNKPGEDLVIGHSSYRIVALLGKGAEGFVYLVQDNSGLKVAKVFRQTQIFPSIDFMLTVFTWWRFRNSLPKIILKDNVRKILLLEYIEGIPVSESWSSSSIISAEDRREIVSQRLKMDSSDKNFWKPAFSSINAVYSFRDRQIYIVDPH